MDLNRISVPAMQDEAEQTRAYFKVFQSISDLWSLTADQQIVLLGAPARSTFFKWKKEGGQLPKDTLERMSHIVSIFKALEILIPDPKLADQWIKKPNKFWSNQSALEKMQSGSFSDLCEVRAYVDAQRGG